MAVASMGRVAIAEAGCLGAALAGVLAVLGLTGVGGATVVRRLLSDAQLRL